jgi:arabinose-5-phosphate isomerase
MTPSKNAPLDDKNYIHWGREALELEASCLVAASKKLDLTFSSAVTVIKDCKGKLVTTGLGKSGHVARKISSTFASTGTSSFYLHPTEALHGDMGMLGQDDCLLAIAFGGETPEILEVTNYARRIGVRVIAITGKITSSLAKSAHLVLDASVEKEACPLNLAPTASSTLALALGDALAMAVMRARGFGERDFASLHPGGALGRKLALVKDHMHEKIPKLSVQSTFAEILSGITNPNYGIVAVVDQNHENLVGAITDGDLRRALVKFGVEAVKKSAQDLMSPSPRTIEISSLVGEAVKKMEELKITSLFVVNGANSQKPLGIIRMHDILAAKIL